MNKDDLFVLSELSFMATAYAKVKMREYFQTCRANLRLFLYNQGKLQNCTTQRCALNRKLPN